jgi:hypothetical protein
MQQYGTCAFCGADIWRFGDEWHGPDTEMQGNEMCPERDPLLEGWRGAAERSWLPHEPIRPRPYHQTQD